ncbi:beta-propeller fold lactonase family protein [Paenibacillus sp. FA6]|uniref:YVTN family beta-propeller repeat protein n=1 Tax=Paenibacillus sp. FA6 TaxID=3413029 RepID=UPI003F6599A0
MNFFKKQSTTFVFLFVVLIMLSGCALETKEEANKRLGVGDSNGGAGKLTSVQFYVPVEDENKVQIIDIVSGEVTGEVAVGEGPTNTVFSSTMRQAYVANQLSSTISVIDTMKLEEVQQIEVGPMPHGLFLTPDNKTLYVSTVADQYIDVIDTQSGEVTGRIDMGEGAKTNYLAVKNNILYVSDHENNCVYIVNASSNTVTDVIQTGLTPRALRLSDDGEKLYVPTAGDGKLTIYNTTSFEKIVELDTVEGATDIVISKDGSTAVITGTEGNAAAIIDLNNNTIITTIADLPGAKHLSFNRQENRVYITLSGSDEVAVFNMETLELENSIKVGVKPHGIQIKALPGIGGSC